MDRLGQPDFLGSTVFTIGRAVEPYLQYKLLRYGYAASALTRVGIFAQPMATVTPGSPSIGGLGPIPSLLITLYAGAALKHIYWIGATNTAEMRPAGGLAVGVYNFLMNAVASLGATHALSRALAAADVPALLPAVWPQYVGIGLFALGVGIEMYSEHTRTKFKAKRANKGRVDDTGLFGVVRHPNYAGYLLWRIGIALTSGSLATTLFTAAFQFVQFTLSIPDLTDHMTLRYGEEWAAYTERVPYRLIPFVY